MILKTPKPARMDEWAIKAELGRRGLSFKVLEKESGITAKSLSMALKRPLPRANAFIANKLGIPVHELWPRWFDEDGSLIPAKYRRKLNQKRQQLASHESQAA